MVATGETVGLTEWIIDDTCLVLQRIQQCQMHCQQHKDCHFFTWYDKKGAFPFTCYLYSKCQSINKHCQDCYSGPRDCNPSNKNCPAIETDFGGTWFCFPEVPSISDPVSHGSRCIFKCPLHITYHVCHDGQWSRSPGEKKCHCDAIGLRNEERDGSILCWPPNESQKSFARAGTYCIHTCHGHPKHELTCHHGSWSLNPNDLTCQTKMNMNVGRTSLAPHEQVKVTPTFVPYLPTITEDHKTPKVVEISTPKRRYSSTTIKPKDISQLLPVRQISSVTKSLTTDPVTVYNEESQFPSTGSTSPIHDMIPVKTRNTAGYSHTSPPPKPVVPKHYSLSHGLEGEDILALKYKLLGMSIQSDPSRLFPEEIKHLSPKSYLHQAKPTHYHNNLGSSPPKVVSYQKFNNQPLMVNRHGQENYYTAGPNIKLNPTKSHPTVSFSPVIHQFHDIKSTSTGYVRPTTEKYSKTTGESTTEHSADHSIQDNHELRANNNQEDFDKNDTKNLEIIGKVTHGDISISETEKLETKPLEVHEKQEDNSQSSQIENIGSQSYTTTTPMSNIHEVENSLQKVQEEIDILELKYKLLDAPIPSNISKLRPGDIKQLPISSYPGTNPLLKHSANDYTIFTPSASQVTPKDTKILAPHNNGDRATLETLYYNSVQHEKRKKHLDIHKPKLETTKSSSLPIKFLKNGGRTDGDELSKTYFPIRTGTTDKDTSLLELARGSALRKQKRRITFFNKNDVNNNSTFAILNDMKISKKSKFPNFPALLLNGISKMIDQNRKSDPKVYRGCRHPAPVLNGKLICENSTFPILPVGSKCYLVCDSGFSTAGDEVASCGTKGAWLSKNPLLCQESMAVLIGGWNKEFGMLDNVEIFDPIGNCRNFKMATLPRPRRGMIAEWIGGRILVCGGMNATEDDQDYCLTYDPYSNRWRTSEFRLSEERHFGSSAKIKADIFAIGGRNGGERPMALGTVEALNQRNQRWQVISDMNLTQERAYHCSVVIDKETLVITGGYSYNNVVGITEAFNVRDRKWKNIGGGNLTQPRYLHSCTRMTTQDSDKELILVTGGYANDYLTSTEIYNPHTDSWSKTGTLSIPRQGGQMTVLNGNPTIFGGFHSMDQFPKTVEQFDVEQGTWTVLDQKLKVPRRYFALVSVPRNLISNCSKN